MIELTRWLPIWRMRPARARCLDHLRPIGIEMNHGLLAIDVLAGLHGVHRGLLVPVVGRGNDYRVNIFAGEDLVIVAGGEKIVTPDFFAMIETAVVAVGNGNQLDAGDLQRRARVALSLAASADQRDLDVIVGGDCTCGFGLRRGQRVDSRAKKCCRRCSACRSQKRSAIQFRH